MGDPIEQQKLDFAACFRTALVLFVVWRLAMFVLGVMGTPFHRYSPPREMEVAHYQDNYVIHGFLHWDAAWYASIAEEGYFIRPPREGEKYAFTNTVFFPLFPYAARALGYVVGDHIIAGLIIANLCAFGAVYYVYRIGTLFFDEERARFATLLMLVFPTSFFLIVYYTESLFLCTAAGSVYHFLNRRYAASGVLGALAMLSRSTGLLLFVVYVAWLAYEMVRRRERFRLAWAWLLLIPAALGVFMYMLYVQVGDPLAFSRHQAGWGRQMAFPLWVIVSELIHFDWSFPRRPWNANKLFEVMTAVGLLAGVVAMIWRRYHPVLWGFVLLGTLLPLSSGRVLSMVRFAVVLFPIFYLLSEIAHRRWLERAVLATSGFLLAMYYLNFLNNGWVG